MLPDLLHVQDQCSIRSVEGGAAGHAIRVGHAAAGQAVQHGAEALR